MHDVCEHVHEWHGEHMIVLVCEHDCESVKHDYLMHSICHNKTKPNDLGGHNRCMYTPWYIKMHDVYGHDEHVHE